MFGITQEQYYATAEWISSDDDPAVLQAALRWDGVMFGESLLEVHEDGRRRRIPLHRVLIRPGNVEVKT